MAKFNLHKGERFNLSKQAGGLNKVKIGLGWEANEDPNGPNFDLDVSAFMIGDDFKIPDDGFFVFYGAENKGNDSEGNERPMSQDEAMLGAVDEKEGGSDDEGGDTEDMILTLNKVDKRVQQIIITVTICKYPHDDKKDRRTLALNFGMVHKCYIRICNDESGEEIARYDLAEKFGNEDAVEFGRLYRLGNEWEFEALGRGLNGSMPALIEMYT
ncbi:MAG: TerD family protein [Bacteroidota bacterium]